MNPVKVGNAIKILRINAGYTQHQLADLMGVTSQAVSKWERGLSVPDVSIVTKLSVQLNVDVDNLLEGNITYLEQLWQGILILDENQEIYSGSKVYNKPLVYLLLSYFMLAGIGDIYIDCPEKDRKWIEDNIGDGKEYGIQLMFGKPNYARSTMVIYNNPFVFGPNLTKYFQRAMSRANGISVLTVEKTNGDGAMQVTYDKYKAVRSADEGDIVQFCAPIVFFPKKYFAQVMNAKNITKLKPAFAEPMGNGMIEYSITNEDSLWDTASFLRYLKKQMGKDYYDLREIAKNRKFIG